jgi:hypothetical protein
MRGMRLLCLVWLAAACGGSSEEPNDLAVVSDLAVKDLEPDATLLVGFWQEPGSGYVWRFTADGQQKLGATAATIDSAPLTAGGWFLQGSVLVLDNTLGLCAAPTANQLGTYDITLTAQTLLFKLKSDSCPERSTIDGEIWTRYVSDAGL